VAFDFPSSPTVGQSVTTPSGSVFTWDSVKWTASAGPASTGNVGRNQIHNPMFNIQQRGAGGWTSAGDYTADRWHQSFSGALTSYVVALADADRAAIGDEAAVWGLQWVFTGDAGAFGYTIVEQAIERVRRLSGKTVTVSFWGRCTSGALKLGVELYENFGSGGSPSAGVPGTGVAVTLSTSWARYSATITPASASGKTLGTNNNDAMNLGFWLSAGTNSAARSGSIGVQSGTIQIWGVQLEIGSVATPLEKPDPQQDCANCQRFYQIGYFLQGTYSPAGVNVWASALPVVTMRGNPTAVITNNSSLGLSGVTITSDNEKTFVQGATTAAASYNFNLRYSLSADL
jgi:hypothetical protein